MPRKPTRLYRFKQKISAYKLKILKLLTFIKIFKLPKYVLIFMIISLQYFFESRSRDMHCVDENKIDDKYCLICIKQWINHRAGMNSDNIVKCSLSESEK